MKKESYLDLDDPRLKQRYEFKDAPLTTETFRVPPSTAARRGMVLWGRRFWFILAVPVAALLVIGIVNDWRLIIAALAIALIVYPGLLVLGWHAVLAKPWAIASYFPQRVTLHPDGEITVAYEALPPVVADQEHPPDSVQPDVPDRYREVARRHVWQQVRKGIHTGTSRSPLPLSIPAAEVTSARRWGRYVVLTYGSRQELFIPVAAMPPGMEADLLEMEPYIM